MRGPRRVDAPPPPPRQLTSDRQFLFPAANAVSYLRAHRYAPTCKLGRLESEGLLTATPTNESADVLRARREKILKGLADARHALAEWPNGHAIPVANLRGRCIEYEAALQDAEAALQDAEAEIEALDSIPSSSGAESMVPSTIPTMDPNQTPQN